ncbi:MAG TPA: glycoside hydrolase family 13 protein [Ilumatobacteraceae bacterium]|nr:glycoside hydrolase family 13 protein [Ilumatobacteraceae bacterium]
MDHDPDLSAAVPPGHEWWRHAVVYQIYVRSFADGNGDGTGDIAGMRSRLPYLEQLGVDAVWINPWYRSPLLDGGYDVADYREINEQFGTTAEAVEFIADARRHGIRVLVDLVPNHTSWDHRWFRDAVASPPGSPARARYHFLDGRGDNGELPPNDWQSVFGGPAWTRVDNAQWYLHLFDESQPDVNWEHPDVPAEFESVMRFWLDRGAAGFRVDVAHALVKAPGYPDAAMEANDGKGRVEPLPYLDRDEIHPIVRRWRRLLDEYGDRMMVAEAWVDADRRPLYLRPDEYHQAFDFDLLSAPWDAHEFRAIISESIRSAFAVGSNPTWVLSNHDVVRHATRYGLPRDVEPGRWLLDGPHDLLDVERGAQRARAAAMVTLALPGSAYVYQGDELGLPEAWNLPVDVLADPIWHDSGHTVKGRDGCRVPMPWKPTGPSLGFGDGGGWLPQPAEFATLSAALQDGDADSTLTLYRTALRLRRDLLVDEAGFELIDLGDDALAFRRGAGFLCVANMGDESVSLPAGTLVLASRPLLDGQIPADTTVWVT